MDRSNFPTDDLCKAAAAELRDRYVPFALVVSLDESIHRMFADC